MEYLTKKIGGKLYFKPIKIIENPSKLKLNSLAIKILKLLSKKPMYPIEIAKELKEDEQKVYYHIHNLRNAGLIVQTREETTGRTIRKYYSPSSNAFGFEINNEYKKFEKEDKIKDFFFEFIKNGVFNGSIVIGAPFPHGPYLTSSRDGHCGIQLAMFLGGLCELPKNKFIAKLDTEVKAEKKLKRNMIIVGGPITNILTYDLNKKLKIKFEWEKNWVLHSPKKKYTGENISLIAKIKNPWDISKRIILFAGLKFEGTKGSIISVTQYFEKTIKKYKLENDFYAVIESLDRDGDGKTDDVKILEIID